MSSHYQTSSRPREVGGSFSSRSRHGAQLSISDSNHHVTEAIGDMYGDDDDWKRESRPLSFIPNSLSDSPESDDAYFSNSSWSNTRPAPSRPHLNMNGNGGGKSHTLPASLPSQRTSSLDHLPLSPTHSLRENHHTIADPATQQFPLNDIDYQSTPAAVAQELSNLQALRRMSMDVGNTSDPDLPSFQGISLMPSVAPTGGDDEDDPSRLFWVPASLHPELAPMEFKTFLENRVKTIKRRSGESTLSPDSLERSGSSGGLRRKKSMLSRQIDNNGGRGAIGYQDGADKLERQKSLSSSGHELKISDLQELDELVRDPTKAMQKMASEPGFRNDQGMEVPASEDMPILPAAPGVGLRRSTRTTYRRGSLRKGERVPFSKRAGIRANEAESNEPSTSQDGPGLKRVPSEPVAENFSRPNRRRGPAVYNNAPTSVTASDNDSLRDSENELYKPKSNENQPQQPQDALPFRKKSYPKSDAPVPQIIETPPQDEDEQSDELVSPISPQPVYPERSSSQKNREPPVSEPPKEPPPRSSRRPTLGRQTALVDQTLPRVSSVQSAQPVPPVQPMQPVQTINDMTQHPTPLPGTNARTDSLTFIPTMTEERKPEKKFEKERDETESISSNSSKKSGWGWFKGGEDKSKKDRKKSEEFQKIKSKASLEKTHDNARLDVLQHSIDIAVQRGRESLLLDRESIDNKLEGERKKESTRKSGETKKEKDGIFSSLFGGKKKGEKETGGKKSASLRALSPDPPHRNMRPDVDFSWTRFSILEERAIYRMAHIKLANPRRALYSQVLLSNFMYSYLAKVQQMHPHVQIPQSAAQKKQQEAERKEREKEQQRREEEERQRQSDQYRYDYHQVWIPQ
jgi:hypothetical protein